MPTVKNKNIVLFLHGYIQYQQSVLYYLFKFYVIHILHDVVIFKVVLIFILHFNELEYHTVVYFNYLLF